MPHGEGHAHEDLPVADEKSYAFTSETGEPLNPSTDYHHSKWLLRKAGIRHGRHTASTVLLLLGVPERIVMAITGWSWTSMAQRYQRVTEPILNDVGRKIGRLCGATLDLAQRSSAETQPEAQNSNCNQNCNHGTTKVPAAGRSGPSFSPVRAGRRIRDSNS